MKAYKYKVIYFDLDHTLWDFDANSRETLLELFHKYKLDKFQLFNVELFINTYIENNHQLWRDYHLGKITKSELRKTRFRKTFLELGLNETLIPTSFEEEYVQICPTKTNLFPHVHETLEYLKNKNYQLNIITNGFYESSNLKLGNTNLMKYFSHIFVSEILGVSKPNQEIFYHALKTAGITANEGLMIGDSLEADIVGALNVGMDAIYFNPYNVNHNQQPTAEIKELKELIQML